MNQRIYSALLALVLCACAPITLTPDSPVVRAAIAHAQTTVTQQAKDNAQISLTLTALPPTYTAVALTQGAAQLAATRGSGAATATQVWANTQSALAAVATLDAAQLLRLQSNGEQGVVMTRTAGQANAEAARYRAYSVAWGVIGWGGSIAVVIVILGAALRVAGPSLLHFGAALAEQIRARGTAYATGREADATYTLKASQGWAARELARQGGTAAQRRASIAPAQQISIGPEYREAIDALKACADIVGPKSRFLPKADEMSGPIRAALDPLKGNGLISVQRGRRGGLYLSRHLTLGELISDLENGFIPLPSPDSGAVENAGNVPIQAL